MLRSWQSGNVHLWPPLETRTIDLAKLAEEFFDSKLLMSVYVCSHHVGIYINALEIRKH